MAPVRVRAFSTVSAAGVGQAALLDALRSGASRLTRNAFGPHPLKTWVGCVPALDGPDRPAHKGSGPAGEPPCELPLKFAAWDARATWLAWLGLVADGFIDAARAAVARHGAARVGLVLGTSASTIEVSETAYRELDGDGGFPQRLRNPRLNTPHALGLFVAEVLGLAGPAVTVSTACSSSAKAFATAERWLRLGLVDAAVVGGVDALCQSVLYGFHALALVSSAPCRPFDRRRNGISVGEAAGFALLERADAGPAEPPGAARSHARSAGNLPRPAGPPMLLGHGEANDAHHMSSPHPQGLGAELALQAALARAGLEGGAIDYVNLHGTATSKNDAIEAALFARHYGPHTLASATKGLTGHAMGAAGMLEAAVCLLALQHGWVPGSTGCEEPDLGGDERLLTTPRAAPLRVAASHSFGFGGSNAVLIFAAGP